LSISPSSEKILIKKKVNELENTIWYLHDAYEGVNVYSDLISHNSNEKNKKKVP